MTRERSQEPDTGAGVFSSSSPTLFPPRVLIDQNVSLGRSRFRRHLEDRGLYTFHVGDKGLADSSDTSVAQEALSSRAAVVTSDKTFIKTVLSQGGECPDSTIVIPQVKKTMGSSATLEALADLVASEVRSTTAPGAKNLAIVDQTHEGFVCYRWQIPEQILKVWHLLEARGDAGVSSKDLASHWQCSRTTATRRARRYVHEGWLREKRSGRRVSFAQSSRLAALLAGARGVVHAASKEESARTLEKPSESPPPSGVA